MSSAFAVSRASRLRTQVREDALDHLEDGGDGPEIAAEQFG